VQRVRRWVERPVPVPTRRSGELRIDVGVGIAFGNLARIDRSRPVTGGGPAAWGAVLLASSTSGRLVPSRPVPPVVEESIPGRASVHDGSGRVGPVPGNQGEQGVRSQGTLGLGWWPVLGPPDAAKPRGHRSDVGAKRGPPVGGVPALVAESPVGIGPP